MKTLDKIKIFFMLTVPAAAVLTVPAAADDLSLDFLVNKALENNSDIISADYDLSSQRFKYESAKAGSLPSIGFSTDTGNNTLYKYTNADEFSFTSFSTERYNRHKTGGGISIDTALPTGGSLAISGSGNIDFALADSEDAEWEYLVSPALSLYLRQPLFVDRLSRSPLRADSLRLANELAALNVEQAEINSDTVKNSIILAVVRTAAVLNNLNRSYELLQQRLILGEQRLELAYRDESAGRLSSLDRLSEELNLKRQNEALIELQFQIESAKDDLENLTGLTDIDYSAEQKLIVFPSLSGSKIKEDINPLESSGVKLSNAARRSVELAAAAVQNGNEPVFEMSGLLRRSDTEPAVDFETAFDDAASSEMDFSLSMALSFDIFDWGKVKKSRASEAEALRAAEKRLESAMKTAELQMQSALRSIKLVEEKLNLVQRGLEYDKSLLERERVRYESGLSSELAVKTVELDLLEQEYQLEQLNNQLTVNVLELYNTGGQQLETLF